MSLPVLHAGIYRHYKGPLYETLGYGHDANNADRVVVVYIGLELSGAKLGPRLSVRTAERGIDPFFDWVCGCVMDDGSVCGQDLGAQRLCLRHMQDTVVKERFEYLGPELTAEMLA